jgi:inner membrane transporter RhtA
VAGIIVVHEFLGALQWLALVCVVVASVGATRAESRLTEPAPD